MTSKLFYCFEYHSRSLSTISLTSSSNEMFGDHFNFSRAFEASP
jgi:hypothetical protein